MAISNLAGSLDRAIRAAGVAILGVSVGDPANKATWKVQPPSLQAQAQPTIDAFDPIDPATVTADVTAQSQLTSRQKDILTTCALIVRRRLGEPAWTALSLQGKKDAVFADADLWRDMRIWAETNL